MLHEAKLKYLKEIEGEIKKVSETYLVEGATVSDAETRITNEVAKFALGEFEVVSIKQVNYSDVDVDRMDKFYNVKYSAIEIEEKTGKEKKKIFLCLVSGNDFNQAFDKATTLGREIPDSSIIEIKETKILDIYNE